MTAPTEADEIDEESVDWEEVDVASAASGDDDDDGQDERNEVALNLVLSKPSEGRRRKLSSAYFSHSDHPVPNNAVERRIRHDVHRVHTLTLVAAGRIRNSFLNNELLKARLLSRVPLPIVNSFSSYSPQTHPSVRDRSRLFDAALKDLIEWWFRSFQILDSIEGMRYRTWTEAELLYQVSANQNNVTDKDVKGKGKAKENTTGNDPFLELLESGEPIHGVKSLMKRAVLMKGSRDMSTQLFISLLRALDVPSRLVFSLQPVTWRGAGGGGRSIKDKIFKSDKSECQDIPTNDTSAMAPELGASVKASGPSLSGTAPTSKNDTHSGRKFPCARKKKDIKSRTIRLNSDQECLADTYSFQSSESEGGPLASISRDVTSSTSKPPPISLRKSRPAKPKFRPRSSSPAPDQLNSPPVFWIEVYSRPMKEWYCVDVTRKKMRCKKIMEPMKSDKKNKMLYVIAFEQDHHIRDVTPRYAHSFGATTMKTRLSFSKKDADWFEKATASLRRSYRLERDVREDEELARAQVTEAMPKTVIGFKNHPNFALERHLRREEAIFPRKPIGHFRGDCVYSRSSVVVCKSIENYLREGKRIKAGELPLKMVKPRVVTINRKRVEEQRKIDGQDIEPQGLYADWQTELLIPKPIIDGQIPRNAYGNFDLFAPHMLPKGAIHLPYKGIAKTAKRLKVSYADAVVSFEFHKRRASPVIEGIIVPELEAEFVLDAYWTSEEAQQEQELAKSQERCLKRWKKLILGLKIKQRLEEDYRNSIVPRDDQPTLVEGASELRDIGIQPEELRKLVSDRAAGLTNDGPQFELYADHTMNIMSMSGLNPLAQDDDLDGMENQQEQVLIAAGRNGDVAPEKKLLKDSHFDVDLASPRAVGGGISVNSKITLIQSPNEPTSQPRKRRKQSSTRASRPHVLLESLESSPQTPIQESKEVTPPSSPLSSASDSPVRTTQYLPIRKSKRIKLENASYEQSNITQRVTPSRPASTRPLRAAAIKATKNISQAASPNQRTLRPRK